METLIKITRSSYKSEHNGGVPTECGAFIFIPAYSWNEKHYYYLIDTQTKETIRWVIDIQEAKAKLRQYMKENYDYCWENRVLDELNFAFVPHSSIYYKEKIYVCSVNSFYIIVLDIKTNTYDFIFDNEMKMISSTNVIIDDHIIYCRYNTKDRVNNVKNKTPIPAETIDYSLVDKTYKIINTYECVNIIHSVSMTSNKQYIISVSTTADPNYPFVEDSKKMYQDKNYMRKMLDDGLMKSQLHIYDMEKGAFKIVDLHDCPAHIEHDPHNPNICYISSHALGVNIIDGFVYSVGHSNIHKLHLSEESQIVQSYGEQDFLRIPSHKLFSYNGKNLIAVTVFPQQIHIIDYDTMTIYKKIKLDNDVQLVDFSDGVFKFPRVDKTPFSVHPINESSYMYFVGGKSIKLFNYETNATECIIMHNLRKDPISVLGHSVLFMRE